MFIRHLFSRVFLPGLLALAALITSAAAGTFTPTGAPSGQENIGAGAVLLPNGQILIAGGTLTEAVTQQTDPNGNPVSVPTNPPVTTAQLYDPLTAAWTPTGSLQTARQEFSMVLLQDGTVLAIGGSDGTNILSSAEIYDPATGLWRKTTPMRTPRSAAPAAVLPDGTVFLSGLGRPELYDPRSATWKNTSAPLAAVLFQAIALLPSGHIMAVSESLSSTDAEIYDPTSDTWTATTGLTSAHLGGTLTVLANGDVLLAGGRSMEGFDSPVSFTGATTEIYDPNTSQWSTTGDLTTNRRSHSASLLPNGKVIVVGGISAAQGAPLDPLDSSEIYDPATGTWSDGGTPAVARASHTATLLPNGKLLLVNGTENAASSAELYDSANPTFTPGGSSLTARRNATYTLLPNGEVLVAGGKDDAGNAVLRAEIYDPQADRWSQTGLMKGERLLHSATLLPNGQVLVTGGVDTTGAFVSTAELYDPTSGTWSFTGSPRFLRALGLATLLPSGRVLVAAGVAGSGTGIECEFYDVPSGTWSDAPSIDQPRPMATATLLSTGNVLLAGGGTGASVTNTTLVYTPIDNLWNPGAFLGTARSSFSATLLPTGKVLAAGGLDADGNPLKSTELYDPVQGEWLPAADLSGPRSAQTATLLVNGQVLVTGQNASQEAELYDPAMDRWSTAGALGGTRSAQSAVLLASGKVLIAGGIVDSTFTNSTVLYDSGLGFDPSTQAQVTSFSGPLASGATLTVLGFDFDGFGGSSSGTVRDSSTNYPVVQLESLANEQVFNLPLIYHSDTSFTTGPIYNLPAGYARLTIFVNGVPSQATLLPVLPGAPAVFTDVSAVTAENGTLFGKFVSNAGPTTFFFEYGTDPQLATFSTSAAQVLPPSSGVTPVSQGISGISAHSQYYYRLVVQNAAGTTLGGIVAFTSPNTPPTATDGTATVTAGSPQTITLPFATTDADGDPVSTTSVTSATLGSILPVPGNQVTLFYDIGFSGTDQITYAVSDGLDTTETHTVTVTVTSPAPTAVADAFFTGAAKSTALTLDVLTNDRPFSSNPDSLMIVGVTQPEFGSVKIAPDGKSLIYTPRVVFSGVSATDTFTYTEQDSTGLTSTGTVKVSNPSNVLKGTFDGLVGNGPNTGYLSLVLGANGSFTGKLRIGTTVSNFKGTLRLDGSADVMAGSAFVNVALDPTTGVITATIMQGSNFYGAQLTRESFSAALAPAPQAGKYTALIPHDNSLPLTVQATATATVSSTGTITGIAVGIPGTGYTVPPLVTITSPIGSGATAVASVANGMVTGVIVTKAGSKYPSSGVSVTIDPSAESRPDGAGYATINVAASGAASVTGKLGDGTPFSASGFVKADGSMALFSILAYKKPGTLLGTLIFQDTPGESDSAGQLDWSKPAQTTAQRYEAGFATNVTLVAGRYVVPAKGENALNFGQATITGASFGAVDGDLVATLGDTISISTDSVVKETSNPMDKLTVKINPANGLVTGSFTSNFFAAPTGQKKLSVTFSGAIVQKQGIAGGFFLGPQHSGIFSFPAH